MTYTIGLIGETPETEQVISLLAHHLHLKITTYVPSAAVSPQMRALCAGLSVTIADSFPPPDKPGYPDIAIIAGPPPDTLSLPRSLLTISFQDVRILCQLAVGWQNSLAQAEEQRDKYISALNAATEGVQIINQDGIIEYINPAFSKITGIHPSERIGESIYEVSRDGSGSQVLKTGKAAVGIRNQAVGSCAEVISNGAPIVIKGQQRGAVVVFQEVTDILRLSKELLNSKAVIESLSDELGHVKSSRYTFSDLIGFNKTMLDVVNLSKRAAKNDSTVLITGESGTGKEIIANAIHFAGPRWNKPFISVNCASIPDSLIESELFGYEKGAYTGADKTKIGKFELANNGTIFLDEIGDLNFNVQAKLLRVLQEKEFERIGGHQSQKMNVKILAATNKNLAEMVQRGLFRADLFYRLQVINIHLPPLRERKDDIGHLTGHIVEKVCRKHGRALLLVDQEVIKALTAYNWPGNVRELENVLTRAVTVCDGNALSFSHIKPLLKSCAISAAGEEILPLADMEQTMIRRALEHYGSTTAGKKAAALALRISLGTLYNKIKVYRLEK